MATFKTFAFSNMEQFEKLIHRWQRKVLMGTSSGSAFKNVIIPEMLGRIWAQNTSMISRRDSKHYFHSKITTAIFTKLRWSSWKGKSSNKIYSSFTVVMTNNISKQTKSLKDLLIKPGESAKEQSDNTNVRRKR